MIVLNTYQTSGKSESHTIWNLEGRKTDTQVEARKRAATARTVNTSKIHIQIFSMEITGWTQV